jgi:Uma2 family endonuclease
MTMVEVKLRMKTVDLPYSLRIFNVTEEMFDEMVDEDTKAELIDGVMVVHSPASLLHDHVAGFLRSLMHIYAEEKELGAVFGPDGLVHLARGRKFGPDAFFVEKSRVPPSLPSDLKEFEGAPNLVLEVLSPSNRADDLEDKWPAYRAARVPEIWFVDPDNREITIDRRERRKYTTTKLNKGKAISQALPGFWIEVEWLWSWPLPRQLACLRKILK